jgi:hypothetical protein
MHVTREALRYLTWGLDGIAALALTRAFTL